MAFEARVEFCARILLGERNVPAHDAFRSKGTVRSDIPQPRPITRPRMQYHKARSAK
jgi:hypothetical protein